MSKPIIILDPGHGGADRANRGPTGYIEADGVLDIGLRLSKLLKAAGYTIHMTRTKDETVELACRGQLANQWKGNLFISLHTNAGGTGAQGIETFHTMNNNWGTKDAVEAKRVAAIVQRHLVQATGWRDRGIKTRLGSNGRDYYAVIRESNMPAVLPEMGFHTHPPEEAALKTAAFRQKLAEALFAAIQEAYPTGQTEQPFHKVQAGDTLSSIARRYGYTVAELAKQNNIADPSLIHPGQIIWFPVTAPDPQPPDAPNSELTAIMGKSRAHVSQLIEYAYQGNPSPKLPHCTLEELAEYYIEEAAIEGVRADVAWAQAIKETGFFAYGGIVLPEQNNYAGIGALNGNAEGQAATFPSPQIGVRAQIQHLKAYASTEPLKEDCVDPRFHLVKRGSAQYVEWLGYSDNPNGAGWAWPGKGYGPDIVRRLELILQQPVKEDEHWGDPALRKLKALGLITADHDPTANLTWAHFATVVARLIERYEVDKDN
jgi:N-acetylmuramoyl-L-alanine amidase